MSLRFCSNTLDRTFIGIDRKGEDALLKLATIESTRWLLVYDSSKILCEKKDGYIKLAELNSKSLLRALGEHKNKNIKDIIFIYNISVLGFKTELDKKICYICIDLEKGEIDKEEDAIIRRIDESSETNDNYDKNLSPFQFQGQRGLVLSLSKEDSSIAGQAISMMHFHKTNEFAGNNAERTKSIELGTKRSFLKDKKVYPRLDPVAIALIINSDGTKCLLGRMKGAPQGFFSCLSGFIEQCESVQNAVRREVYEEAGIQVGEVILYDSQPWPLGRGGSCELMIGCIGIALTEEINITEIDAVEEICWFDRNEISIMLDKSKLPIQANVKDQAKFIPGDYAIAHHLIKAFIDNNFDKSKSLFPPSNSISVNNTPVATPQSSSSSSKLSVKTPIESQPGIEEIISSGKSQALIDKKSMETKSVRNILKLVSSLTITTSMAFAGIYLKKKKW